MTAPPFAVSLVTTPLIEQIRAAFGSTGFEAFTDISDWLRLPANQKHPVELRLGVVNTLDERGLPPVGEPVFD